MKTRTKTLRKGALLAGIAVTSTGEVLDGGENWTLTRTLRDSLGTSVMRDITYYDGLGYPTQAIQADASPAGGSIVTPIYYDNVRRDDARTYLPFVSATGMGKVASPFTAQQSWYTSQHSASEGAAAYAVRTYEPSALNRVTASRRPGAAYASGNHDAEVSYSTNAASSVWKVKEGTTSATLTVGGYYPAGSLHCVTAVDEDSIITDTYDIRSQLLTHTAMKGSTTLFSETLRYDSPTRGTAARYGGGISEVMTLQGSARNTYGFTYDAAGRLMTTTRFTGTNGTSGSAAYTERNITYNRNGALLTLKRYGSGTSTAQDDYSYTYSGPLLTGVSGKDEGSNINASFSHDGNGNTTADGRANLSFAYNLLNLPETVTSGNTQTATYHWLADGTKYQVEDASGNGVIYAGDLTYAVTVSGGNTTYALESAEASVDGAARFLKNGTAMTPYYTIKDHLGSVRTIVNASGTVQERNDYYPFGQRTTFGASYSTLAANRRKFSGKEDQTTIGSSTLPYLDFGARMYDSKLVRWNTYDPMAEKYYGINPYVYCNGDPVNLVDPDGSIVKPKSQREVEMIRNTLPQKARQYVQLTKEGYIDGKTLSKYKGKSQNYSSLTELVESNYIVFVSLSDSFSFLDKNGNAGIHTMSYFPFDTNHPEDRDIGFQSVSGVTTGESGFLGKVLFPDKEGDENSTTSNIEIYVNKSLSTVGSAEIFSHEAYGHALRYIRTGGDHQKASHQIKGTFDENNELKRMIIESRRETVKNLTK